MTYLAVYVLLLLLPGFVLVRAVGLRTPGALLAMPLSYLLLVAAMVVLGLLGVALRYAALPVALVTLAAAGAWWRRHGRAPRLRYVRAVPAARRLELVAVPCAIVVASTVWLAIVGPYDEVPADAWWHLGRFQDSIALVDAGETLSLARPADLWAKDTGYWYLVHALLCHYAGISVAESRIWLSVANTAVLLVTFYLFAVHVLSLSRFRPHARTAASALAVVFFVLHFGINVFAYTRYYVYGPTFLNLAVYFAFTWVWLRYLRGCASGHGWLLVAGLLILLMAAVHIQEALFAGVTALLTAMIMAIRRNRRRLAPLVFPGRTGSFGSAASWRVGRPEWLVLGAVACWLALHLSAQLLLKRNDPRPLGYLFSTETLVPFLRNLYIVDPALQFYQVLTAFGVLVYALFLLWRRVFRGNPYLWAGMLSPLFTVLSPVFIDLFLRFSWPSVAWRMSLLMPLAMVAGALVVAAGRDWELRPLAAGIRVAVVVGLLAVTLAPVDTTYFVQPFSRVYTLTAVKPDNGPRQWLDMINMLQDEPPTRVVTDPVTGYVINGLTPHQYPGYKFTGYGALPVNRSGYSAPLFREFAGGLVVINLRDGGHSRIGELSRHWPDDVLKTTTYYSLAFREFVTRNTDLFQPVWSAAGIAVYRVVGRQWWNVAKPVEPDR